MTCELNYGRLAWGLCLLRGFIERESSRPTRSFDGQSGNKRGAFFGHNTTSTFMAFPLFSGRRRSSLLRGRLSQSLDPRGLCGQKPLVQGH